MKLSDFDFELPEGLIATRPARPRSAARLLLAEDGTIADRVVSDLPAILRPGDLLVLTGKSRWEMLHRVVGEGHGVHEGWPQGAEL